MKEPDFQEVIKVLSQESSREILRVLGNESKTLREVFEETQETSNSLKYRESVYKVLEKLNEVGLVEKIREGNSVEYRRVYSDIEADFLKEELELKK